MEELKGQVQDLNEKLETIRSEFDENNNILAHIHPPQNLTHIINQAGLYLTSYQGLSSAYLERITDSLS